jgi:co-chaperonin GroES (HSP10)
MSKKKADIDQLLPKRSLIDLENHVEDSLSLQGYKLSTVMDDIVLCQYVDTIDNEVVSRNGVVIPLNASTKAWRLGRAVLVGVECQYVKTGDIVCFPNDKGMPVSNINVDGFGVVKNGMFLNEQRMFGICKSEDES